MYHTHIHTSCGSSSDDKDSYLLNIETWKGIHDTLETENAELKKSMYHIIPHIKW